MLARKSSRLPEMCQEIADIHRHTLLLRNDIISRSIYPFVLLHATLVIPAFPGVFLGQSSPMALLYGPMGLWGLIALLFLAAYVGRRFGVLGRLIDVPFIRLLLEPFILANALRVLSACGTAGMLWPDALNSSADACGNQVVAGRLRRAAEDLRHDRLPDLPAAIATITSNRFTQEQVAVGNTAGDL